MIESALVDRSTLMHVVRNAFDAAAVVDASDVGSTMTMTTTTTSENELRRLQFGASNEMRFVKKSEIIVFYYKF